jgi:hypothetical protein
VSTGALRGSLASWGVVAPRRRGQPPEDPSSGIIKPQEPPYKNHSFAVYDAALLNATIALIGESGAPHPPPRRRPGFPTGYQAPVLLCPMLPRSTPASPTDDAGPRACPSL